MHHFFQVAIIGRPNVGKSTLFNRIIGARQAITSRESGTTRDRVIADARWLGKNFTLIDTAGVLFDFYGFKEEEIERLSQTQIEESLNEADLILFVVSHKDGVTPQDEEISRKIRKLGKKIILVCNKADNLEKENMDAFSKLGVEEMMPTSAATGRRVGNLLDRIVREIKSDSLESEAGLPKMTIIGRPNVGKSTLFNHLIGRERSIVSNVAGTTRDAINEVADISGREVEIIDTAGLRRRGTREVGVEKFSVYRAFDSIFRSDLVMLVVDGEEGITRGDAHLAQLAIDKKKELIIVINKIDTFKTRLTNEVDSMFRYKFMNRVSMVAISAKTGENVARLKKEVASKLPLLGNGLVLDRGESC